MERGPWVDLHTHTTASDGTLSPAQLVDEASRLGLASVAITDHDTIDGVSEAMDRGVLKKINVIPAVEISLEAGAGRTFHLLGYHLDLKNRELIKALAYLQRARSRRNARILRHLARMGMRIDREILGLFSPRGQLGRPHLAQAMVQHRYVDTVDEAFQRFLGKGRPAYEEKFRMEPEAGIRLVRQAGGVPVLAHPHTLGMHGPLEMEAFVAGLVKRAGLAGIEVLYPEHDAEQRALYRYLAEKYDLVMTGGTDFHGSAKPGISLGWGKGDLRVPLSWSRRLHERAGMPALGGCS